MLLLALFQFCSFFSEDQYLFCRVANIIPVVFNFCTGAFLSLHQSKSSVRLARGSLSSAVIKPFQDLSFFSFSLFYLLATIYTLATSAIVFTLDENPLKIFPQSCYFSSFHYFKLKVVKIMYLASDLQRKKKEIGKKKGLVNCYDHLKDSLCWGTKARGRGQIADPF